MRTYRKLTVWSTCDDGLNPDTVKRVLDCLEHGFLALCEPGSREQSEAEIKQTHDKPTLGAALHVHQCGSDFVKTMNSPNEG